MKPLTVKELIAKLEKCDPEMEVYFEWGDGCLPCEIIQEVWKPRQGGGYYSDKDLKKFVPGADTEKDFYRILVLDEENL